MPTFCLDEDERTATYYIGLLDDVYCHADAHEQARWFGDGIDFKAKAYEADLESFAYLLIVLRKLGAGEAGLARARRVAAFPARVSRRSARSCTPTDGCRRTSPRGSGCRVC